MSGMDHYIIGGIALLLLAALAALLLAIWSAGKNSTPRASSSVCSLASNAVCTLPWPSSKRVMVLRESSASVAKSRRLSPSAVRASFN